MLSKVSQSQRDKYCMIPLNTRYLVSEKQKSRTVGARGGGGGRKGYGSLVDTEFQLY